MTEEQDVKGLEPFFRAARAGQSDQPVSDDFLARLMADADRVQADLSKPAPATRQGRGLLARLSDAIAGLGGWAPVTGLAACAVFGVYLGYANPAGVADTAGSFLTGQDTEVVDLFTSLEDFAAEG